MFRQSRDEGTVVLKTKLPTLVVLGSFFFMHAILVSCSRTHIQAHDTGILNKSITLSDLKRSYHLYVPSTYLKSGPAPLVIALHGGGVTGQKVAILLRLNPLADQYGFIAVYPDAVDHHWNDGRALDKYRSQRENIDDVGFIAAMIDAIDSDFDIDQGRVYVTGASNGAMMALRLGCELAPRITAIAPVIGSMPANLASRCAPANPVPLIMINGTADPLVPYEGGYVHVFRKKLGKILSVQQTVDFWVARNGCSTKPQVSMTPDTDPEDGTRVQKSAYSQCTDDAGVVLYTIRGGGHTWPGGNQYLPEFLIGKTSRDLDASEVIWKFFNEHTK